MGRIKISLLSMVLVLWVALPLRWSPSTQAQGTLNSRLDGTYSFHLLRNCTRENSNFGFDATTFIVNPGGVLTLPLFQVQGTIIFNGSGNASVTQTEVVNLGGVTVKNQETCPFTYVVGADGTFTLQGNCSGTNIQGGSFVGQTVSTTGIKLKGQIGTRRRTLIFFGDGPNIETFVAGSSPGTLRQQLCSQTGTAVRI